MTRAEILAQTTWTKTRRIEALLALGLTRTEVAAAMGVGYGFVQNVYAAWQRRTGAQPAAAARIALALAAFAPQRFTRRFGIELECYGVQRATLVTELQAQGLEAQNETYNHSTRPHWKTVSDGSLVGENTLELVSPVLEGRDGLDEVASACRALRQTNARVNSTCGFHAHFDARDMPLDQMKRVCLNYLRLETMIDSVMAPSRRANTNRFCGSINRPGVEARILAATTTRELEQAVNGGNRYFKVNLQAFFRHGTIEFRQHHGTVCAEKITFWLKFLHCLIDYSAQHEVPAGYAATPAALTAFCPREVATFYTRRQQALAA